MNCQKRQTDPVKGASNWARLVIAGEQVLICPDCQSTDDKWASRSDRCPECGSTRLVVVMDSVVCKSCNRDFEREGFRPNP